MKIYPCLQGAPVRCAIRPYAELPYRRDPTFPKVSTPVPADARIADNASEARAETGVRGGSEDVCEEMDALDAGRPCTRAGVDVSLRGELNCGSCGVGTGDGVVGWPKGLFVAKGLFELHEIGRSAILREMGTGLRGLPKCRLLRHERGLLGSLQLRGLILEL
jgi:hypothetical protein